MTMELAHSAQQRRQEKRYWVSGLSRGVAAGFLAPYLILCGALIVYPLLRLIIFSLSSGRGIANFSSFFHNEAELRSLMTTVVDSILVTVFVLLIGAFIAWRMRTSSSRFLKILLSIAIFVPLWMSAITKIYAFTILFQRLGIINQVLQSIGLIQVPVSWLYNQPIVIAGIVYQMLPYGTLPLYVTFSLIDLDLVHASESLGASRWYALRTVVAPLSLGGMLVTGVMVYMISLGYFLTPVLLGGATSPFTASLISQDIFTYYDVADASVSAVLLIAVAAITAFVAYKIGGKERLSRAVTA